MAGEVCGQVTEGLMCQNKEFLHDFKGSGDPVNVFQQENGMMRG